MSNQRSESFEWQDGMVEGFQGDYVFDDEMLDFSVEGSEDTPKVAHKRAGASFADPESGRRKSSSRSSQRSPRSSKTTSKRESKTKRRQTSITDATGHSTASSSTDDQVVAAVDGGGGGVRESERAPVRYSVSELVATLGNEKDTSQLPQELERRVLDFRLAQQKRREKYGEQNKCGIFGMYAHLSDVRIDLEWSEDAAWRRNHGHPYLSWTDFDAVRHKGYTNRPWFTYFVIVLCTIMLIVEFGFNDWVVEPLSVNPLIGPSAQAMIDAGARDTPLIVNQGQWFRIFSPLFLHAGIIHYVINMAALWFVGGAVEQSHGVINAMILFFVAGVGGTILSAIFLPQYISVGASGGIFGLIGGCVADICINWNLLFIKSGEDDTKTKRRNIVAIGWLVIDFVLNIIIGFTPYVDNFSHLGGLVYGIACGVSLIEPLPVGFFGVQATPFEKIKAVVVRFFGLIFSIVLIIATTVVLATMNVSQPPCYNCKYVSCVPFPFWTENKWWYCDDCSNSVINATLFKNGTEFYSGVELTCPNGDLVLADVWGEQQNDRGAIQRQLPAYCRRYCNQ